MAFQLAADRAADVDRLLPSPFTWTFSTDPNIAEPAPLPSVAASATISPLRASAQRRATILTKSPMTVKSRRAGGPIGPKMAWPVNMPMPTPRGRSAALTAVWISAAAGYCATFLLRTFEARQQSIADQLTTSPSCLETHSIWVFMRRSRNAATSSGEAVSAKTHEVTEQRKGGGGARARTEARAKEGGRAGLWPPVADTVLIRLAASPESQRDLVRFLGVS